MTTSPSTLRLLSQCPEYQQIVTWFEGIQKAAGPDAWVDLKIANRNGKPHDVLVQCALKLADSGKEKS